MRTAAKVAALFLACTGVVAATRASRQPLHRYVPPAGFVPDSATAVRIAVAVWTPIYGAAQLAREQPYRARMVGGVWTVEGSLPVSPPGARRVGGVAIAEIAKADARVLRVSHGR